MDELVRQLAARVELPRMGLVTQATTTPALADVAGTARAETRRLLAEAAAGPGASQQAEQAQPGGSRGPVAVGVGSRGIAHLAQIVAVVIDELRAGGYDPFIVPAMGSHGGGTPEGQIEVLEGYGVTEATMGVPIRATMETVVHGDVDGVPVHVDRYVAEAGRAFLVARVKPHTDFRGSIESGPAKMAAIGLGKQAGAATLHGLGLEGLRDVMPRAGRYTAGRLVLGAVAIVENDADETASITGLTGAEVGGPKETDLLEQARRCLPRVPFADLDVLVVERIGKDISGTGMDPNVAGRWMVTGLAEPDPLPVRSIVALDVTDGSHGNALGMGLADFTTARLASKVDPAKIAMNAITSGWASIGRSRLPITMPDDRGALLAALANCGSPPGRLARVVWIQDTLHTATLAVSEALWGEAAAVAGVSRAAEPEELPFDADGNLTPLVDLTRARLGVGAAGRGAR
jgi:hypothetical protein